MSDDFDVAIVGLGPVGATLAHLLGLLGVRTVVLEREAAPYPLPRAVHFDDEIMRVFQWIGVAEALRPSLRINPGMRFVAPDGSLLLDWPRPQEESALGWHPSWRFHQPDLEHVLRDRLAKRDGMSLRTNCEVTDLRELPDRAVLEVRDRDSGRPSTLCAQYVVGCDGARSFIRQRIGSEMHDMGFRERWLVVDVLLDTDKPELGDHSIQYCDPDRPATYVRCPGNRRRWEIAVRPDESEAEISRDTSVWRLLSGWLKPSEARLERRAVYTFHSLIAKTWRRERLLIAGDAAHQTPPFMGQGMCAGIRDAANLAWKLADVIAGRSSPAILDSYQSERLPNCAEFIATAIRLGNLINATDPRAALEQGMPTPDATARMQSIYPPLGPGLGSGRHGGRQFGQPRLRNGRRMDDSAPYRPVIVARSELCAGYRPPEGVHLVTTVDAPEAAGHLDAFDAGAALLRPDRYILETARRPHDFSLS